VRIPLSLTERAGEDRCSVIRVQRAINRAFTELLQPLEASERSHPQSEDCWRCYAAGCVTLGVTLRLVVRARVCQASREKLLCSTLEYVQHLLMVWMHAW
jgi:hypothetical protein